MTTDNLIDAVQALTAVLQREQTLGTALAGIAEVATYSVPGCDAASVAISIRGRPATTASTARVALELDLVQYDTGDGPCLTAFRDASTVRVDLVNEGDAFPHFARSARALGIVSVLSVPASWGPELVGTMNLYSRGGRFDQTAQSIAIVLAGQVGIAISRSPEFAAARGVVEEAQRNADDRAEVNLATGLLMAYEGCTADVAEGLLRHAAAQDERTILEVAQRIIRQHQTSR